MWIWIICGSLLLFLGILLSIPLRIGLYACTEYLEFSLGKLFKGSFRVEGTDPKMDLFILGFRWNVKLKRPKRKARKQKEKQKKKSNFFTFRKGRKLLASFQVKRLKLDLDTGDVVWNAYLIPLFTLFSSRGFPVSINYTHDFEFDLLVQNRGWRILKAILA